MSNRDEDADQMDEVIKTGPSARNRHSPCVGVCEYDEKTGYCIGCARNADEITQWASLDEAAREAIWLVLPERHARLGAT